MIQIQVTLGIITILIGLAIIIFNKFFSKIFVISRVSNATFEKKFGKDGGKAGVFVIGLLMIFVGIAATIMGFLDIRIAGL